MLQQEIKSLRDIIISPSSLQTENKIKRISKFGIGEGYAVGVVDEIYKYFTNEKHPQVKKKDDFNLHFIGEGNPEGKIISLEDIKEIAFTFFHFRQAKIIRVQKFLPSVLKANFRDREGNELNSPTIWTYFSEFDNGEMFKYYKDIYKTQKIISSLEKYKLRFD